MRFAQVDVFTSQPCFGNPVAVVLDADGLSDEQMQRIAAWTNLSETTFALPPEGPGPAYRLRIFTPRSELPFAGHPTVGSCHALLEAGIVAPEDGRLIQECGAGRLPLRVSGEGPERWIFVETPEAKCVGEHAELRSELAAALGAALAGGRRGDPLLRAARRRARSPAAPTRRCPPASPTPACSSAVGPTTSRARARPSAAKAACGCACSTPAGAARSAARR